MKRISMWMLAAILICGTSIVTSCSNEDLMEEINEISAESNSHRITAEQAKQNALDFVMNFDETTRTNRNNLRVAEVKVVGGNAELTRSIRESVDLDTLFYVVNFANNEGFVIAAADDRENLVFAYVDEGNYDGEEIPDNGFGIFMSNLLEDQASNRLAELYERPTGNNVGLGTRRDKFEVMSPLLVTKWGQEKYWGYNRYSPNGSLTGCVPTAVAQICSYLKRPTHVSWSHNGVGGESPINWDDIINNCRFDGNPSKSKRDDLCDQIAHLMRFWGVAFKADYGSSIGSTTSVERSKVVPTLKYFEFNATNFTDYNATNVINDLKKGNRIIYMSGSDGYEWKNPFKKVYHGHAWVVDGYIHSIKNNKESIYIHCNWGWYGQKNGYFLSDVLNAGEGPVYEDHEVTTRANYNYRYKLQTSTISK